MTTNRMTVALRTLMQGAVLVAALAVVLMSSGTPPTMSDALSSHFDPLAQVPVDWMHHLPVPVNIDQVLATLTN